MVQRTRTKHNETKIQLSLVSSYSSGLNSKLVDNLALGLSAYLFFHYSIALDGIHMAKGGYLIWEHEQCQDYSRCLRINGRK